MDDVALANYVIGVDCGRVSAGHVCPTIAKALNVPPATEIWFSDYTLLKLKERHGEITFEHYRYMPRLLLDGFAATSHKKSRHIELWWLDKKTADPSAFLAILKATAKDEIFVATFHPLHWREARRLARKATKQGRLLRSQTDYGDFQKI